MSVASSNAKSGWLYRQSSVLKKWRRYWFTLTQDGFLRYFETELSSKAEDVLNIPMDCIAIKTGAEVSKIHPPEGMSSNFLLKIDTRNGQSWVLCGEDVDDMKAWQLALQEARLIRHHVRSPSAPPFGTVYQTNTPMTVVTTDDMVVRHVYTPYPAGSVNYTIPGAVYYAGYPQVVQVPTHTTVLYNRDPYYYSPMTGLAFGMLTGAALGSLMWTPFLWHC